MQFPLLTKLQLIDFLEIYNLKSTDEQLIENVDKLYHKLRLEKGKESLFPKPIIDLCWATYLANMKHSDGTPVISFDGWDPNSISKMNELEITQFTEQINLPIKNPIRLVHIFRLIQVIHNSIIPNKFVKTILINKLKNIESPIIQPDEPFHFNYRKIILIDDGAKYQFGTKHRITADYVKIKKQNYNEFVYVGPSTAMGAYALAAGCIENSVKCTLFLVGPNIPKQGKIFTDNITYSNLVKNNLLSTGMKEAFEIGEKYVQGDPTRLLVPFGINDVDYKNMLYDSLINDNDLKTIWKNQPKRMWMAVGSGTLLSILLYILPKTHFLAVQGGTELKYETLHYDPNKIAEYKKRITLYKAPEKFTQSAEVEPPYSSLNNYDAKLWRFVMTDAQNGDCIWNVARNY